MKKINDVMLIANFWHFKEEKASSRYSSMANLISKEGYELEVVTSNFRHLTKKQRNVEDLHIADLPYKVTLLNEPGYRKNVSILRIYSHHRLAKNIKIYLEQRKKPDAIIVSVPSLSVGSVVTKYAKDNGIKLIIDIQDLWPEAFKMAFDIPIISNIIFAPMMQQANKIYKRADHIMAVSETYVKRGLSVNKKGKSGTSIYIGTDPILVQEEKKSIDINKSDSEFWIGYIGTLGHSYDIKVVIDAIKVLKKEGIKNIRFKIMGEGPLKDEFQQYAQKEKIECEFMGFLKYGRMMAILEKCDIAVNPINGKSVASIINKVSDYAIAGMPVVNTQNSEEYRKLLERYEAGINCESGNSTAVADAIRLLYFNEELRTQMKNNSLRMAEEKFDRTVTYKQVVHLLKKMENE